MLMGGTFAWESVGERTRYVLRIFSGGSIWHISEELTVAGIGVFELWFLQIYDTPMSVSFGWAGIFAYIPYSAVHIDRELWYMRASYL